MKRSAHKDSGIALIVTLLLTFVFTLMTLGFFFVVTGEQRIAASDRDNGIAYYAAQAGLEKMSAQLVGLFQSTASPTTDEVDNLWKGSGPTYGPPTIAGVTFPTYQISYTTVGSPPQLQSSVQQIGGSGPLNGLQAIITPFTLTVTADSITSTEVKLTRNVQEVAVPVFQFGIFSDNDLSFFAGPPLSFGGRVHTNGNLFLAEGDTVTGLTFGDRVTAYKQVIRTQLSNGYDTSIDFNGLVNVVTTNPGTTRPLARTEGSLVGGPGSPANSNWPAISLSTYNGNIKTKTTGAAQLNLSFALPNSGNTPIQMIQRPPAGESPKSTLGSARLFNQASLRILISDSPTVITTLPGVTSNAPYPLDESLIQRLDSTKPLYLPPVSSCNPPFAQSRGYAVDPDYMSPAGTSLLAGGATSYIKIEIQLKSTPVSWQDVTQEILGLGVLSDPSGANCAANKSIIHLEQLRSGVTPPSANAKDFIPINMYDPREGELRDNNQANLALGGIMNVVELDVRNLQQWFANKLDPIKAPSGALALNQSGYIIYFSDRRSNSNGTSETGEFGWDDVINPLDSAGTPNGILDPGEDVHNGTTSTFNTYGKTPRYSFTPDTSPLSPWPAWFLTPPHPVTTRISWTAAAKNGVIFFRRALRLVNGKLGNLPPLAHANCTSPSGGFTVAAENPVYVLGDYNADTVNLFNDAPAASPPLCHVPAAIMADAVTVLSNNYSDSNDLSSGDILGCPANRCASSTFYRMAIIAGKNNSFSRPSWSTAQEFGTDGGVHNFIRYIEDWSVAGTTLNYSGSLLSFYVSRQATGIFKCCNVVYLPPTRNYSFDLDFTNINTLPPGTPRFSDVNALSYMQAVLSSQ